jgi:hypothetical protein
MTEAQHKVVIASLVVIGLVLAYVMLDKPVWAWRLDGDPNYLRNL